MGGCGTQSVTIICSQLEEPLNSGSHLAFGATASGWTFKAMGESDPNYKRVQSVVASWKQDSDLCRRATTGKMANVGNPKTLTRKDVDVNEKLMGPVLELFGQLPAFNMELSWALEL